MKLLDTIKDGFKKTVDFIVEQKDKALAALGIGVLGGAPTASNAAVTFNDTTGFAGTLDLAFFYSAVPLVVTAMVAVIAVGLGIKMFKKA